MPENPCLDSYYFSFDTTGVPVIDKILSAIAAAGTAFHSADQWTDHAECTGFDGYTPVEWIQNAAKEAAIDFGILEYQAGDLLRD